MATVHHVSNDTWHPRTVVGLFREADVAQQVVGQLQHLGIPSDRVLVLSRRGRLGARAIRRARLRTEVAAGALVGGIVSGPISLLAALASLDAGLLQRFWPSQGLPAADIVSAVVFAATVTLVAAAAGAGVGAQVVPRSRDEQSATRHRLKEHVLVMVETVNPAQLRDTLALLERQGGKSVVDYATGGTGSTGDDDARSA
jgi:hypothetical protein